MWASHTVNTLVMVHRRGHAASQGEVRSGYFVLGNHDRVIRKIQDQFVWVKDIAEVNIRQQPIVLCHYAMRVWHQSGRGAWQLYGHSHGKLPAAEGSRSLDVGVDTNAFRPYSFGEIQSRFADVE